MSVRTLRVEATRISARCMPISVRKVFAPAWVTVMEDHRSWEIRSRTPDPSETTLAVTLVTLLVIRVAMVERELPAAMVSGLPVRTPVESLKVRVAAVVAKALARTSESRMFSGSPSTKKSLRPRKYEKPLTGSSMTLPGLTNAELSALTPLLVADAVMVKVAPALTPPVTALLAPTGNRAPEASLKVLAGPMMLSALAPPSTKWRLFAAPALGNVKYVPPPCLGR